MLFEDDFQLFSKKRDRFTLTLPVQIQVSVKIVSQNEITNAALALHSVRSTMHLDNRAVIEILRENCRIDRCRHQYDSDSRKRGNNIPKNHKQEVTLK